MKIKRWSSNSSSSGKQWSSKILRQILMNWSNSTKMINERFTITKMKTRLNSKNGKKSLPSCKPRKFRIMKMDHLMKSIVSLISDSRIRRLTICQRKFRSNSSTKSKQRPTTSSSKEEMEQISEEIKFLWRLLLQK